MGAAAAVRPADVSDAAAIAAVYGPYVEHSCVSFEADAPDGTAMRGRMLAQPRLPWFVATREAAVVGYCYATQHRPRAAYRWSVECSVYLAASEHRRGTGRALYERLLPELRLLGYATALAGVTLPNPASVGLHESVGFTPVGVFTRVGYKHGAWHDVGWWQLPLGPPGTRPAVPRAWAP